MSTTHRMILATAASLGLAFTTAHANNCPPNPWGGSFCYRLLPLEVCTMDTIHVEDDEPCIILQITGKGGTKPVVVNKAVAREYFNTYRKHQDGQHAASPSRAQRRKPAPVPASNKRGIDLEDYLKSATGPTFPNPARVDIKDHIKNIFKGTTRPETH